MLELTRDYRDVWKIIGEELLLDKSVLESIENEHRSNHHCLHLLITKWLNGDNLSESTWEEISKAIKSKAVTKAVAGMCINVQLDNVQL